MSLPTLRQLEYVAAIADHGSFHAAARACHVSQPGLSAQIQQLEATLGLQLFERDRRKVLITTNGEEIVARAREVLRSAASLAEAAQTLSRPFTGRIRLGVIPTIAPYLVPKALPVVRAHYPDLVFQIAEAQTDVLLERLREGTLDLLLLAGEADLGTAETLELFRDAFLVALPEGHSLAGRRRLNEQHLSGERVLLLEDGHCLRDQALSFCHKAGAQEDDEFRASSLPTLLQMVAGGAGITLVPELSVPVEGRAGGLRLIPFRKPAPYRTVCLAWRPGSPRESEFRSLGACFAEPQNLMVAAAKL